MNFIFFFKTHAKQSLWPAAVATWLLLGATLVGAATTQIATEPLITMSEVKPKPNLMVILDDSGSMDWEYMPDAASGTGNFGYESVQCNGVAYNPAFTYTPPLNADGTSFANASFDSAWDNGFESGSATTDLSAGTRTFPVTLTAARSPALGNQTFTFSSNSATKLGSSSFPVGHTIRFESSARVMEGQVTAWNYDAGTDRGTISVNVTTVAGSGNSSGWNIRLYGRFYYNYAGSEPALSWSYNTDGSTNTTTTYYNECKRARSASRGSTYSNVFELVPITQASPEAVKTNYANWYSYYRKRMYLMRSAMGQALNVLDDGYRIGFMSINQRGSVTGTGNANFRPVNDFDSTQKANFYSSLYTAAASGTTPLRAALSTAGRYYAKNLNNQSTEPMQYACQRNFALLTTDGFWNESFNGNAGLGGAQIGNADGGVGVPYEDSYANTLADVAYYYYSNDLRNGAAGSAVCTGASIGGRPGLDVCANIVPPLGADTANHQRMITYTIGLGVSGMLSHTPDYLTQTTGDYADIVAGTRQWPEPINNTATTIDDLWHAAVNGRGQHYSAQNADELAQAIQGVVEALLESTGAATSASTSVLDLVQGEDNMAFEASYTTGVWTGDVLARRMDALTAELEDEPVWSAKARLDSRTTARNIYFNNGSSLTAFTWSNLGGLQSHFTGLCSTNSLSQCATLSSANQTLVNNGDRLVEFLRGARDDEATNTATNPLFRVRASRLGDVINSKPIHVGKPPFSYTDAGYSAFKEAQKNRRKVVYVGANDGMLHALDAGTQQCTTNAATNVRTCVGDEGTGEELWAFIPTAVIPNLYRLADTRYGATDRPHQYYVDGKTVQGDVYANGAWHTILVGGLNSGGRAYYALDITDPENPELLWEFTNDNLGLSYSDPIITKHNGTWVVAFSSGYNNVSPGTGVGRLFMVNAMTGALMKNLPTTQGTTITPSGLAKINVWVRSLNDNTAMRFYGGDLLGNVWRFVPDTTATVTGGAVVRLAEMRDAGGNPQPITTELKLREYLEKPIVVVTTGRYLGRDDVDDTQTQSIAAIRDPDDNTGWGNIRTSTRTEDGVPIPNFKLVTINQSGTTASAAAATVNWNADGGWRADFPTPGERVNIPAEWDGTTLLVATAIPEGDQCKSGGSSWMYRFGLDGGQTNGKQYSDQTLIVGFGVVTNSEGNPKILIRESAGNTEVEDGTGLGGGTLMKRARRVSWRELIHDRTESD